MTPEPFGKVNLAGSGDFIGGRLGGSRGKLRLGELTNCRMVGDVMECEWGKGEIRKWEPVTVPYCITLFWHEARDQILDDIVLERVGGSRFEERPDDRPA